MIRTINNESEAKSIFGIIKKNNVFLVGAGELGRLLGEYFDYIQLQWDAYVDGSINVHNNFLLGRRVISYEEIDVKNSNIYIITTPRYSCEIEERLLGIGVAEETIYSFECNRVIYELYSKANALMELWINGVYRACSFGECNPDQTYMVLERSMIYEGITSNIRRFLMGIDFADKNGFVPVIDQVYYPAIQYQEINTIGKDNPWEYYFKQPAGIGTEDLKKGFKNVRYYNLDDTINYKYLSEPLIVKKNGIHRLERWHYLVNKYIHFTDDLKAEADTEYERIIPKGKRVIGVKIREEMMKNIDKKVVRGCLPYQPEIDTVINDTAHCLEAWGCDYVYIMCESIDVLDRFKMRFGEKLVYKELERPNYEKVPDAYEIKMQLLHDDSVDKNRRTKDYLIEIYILSKCNALIGGDNGTTEMACLINGGYENMILYHNGYTPEFTD